MKPDKPEINGWKILFVYIKMQRGEENKSAYNLLTIQFLSKSPHTYDMRNNLIIVKKNLEEFILIIFSV